VGLIYVCKYLIAGNKDEKSKLFSTTNRTRVNGYKLTHVKFNLNKTHNTFSLWVWSNTGTGCPDRLWSLSFDNIQNITGYGPNQSTLADVA